MHTRWRTRRRRGRRGAARAPRSLRSERIMGAAQGEPERPALDDAAVTSGLEVGGLQEEEAHGQRPLLGLLVFDDGSTYTVDAEYLLGRMPEADPRVAAGALRSLALEDTSGAVSRVHAQIVVNGGTRCSSTSARATVRSCRRRGSRGGPSCRPGSRTGCAGHAGADRGPQLPVRGARTERRRTEWRRTPVGRDRCAGLRGDRRLRGPACAGRGPDTAGATSPGRRRGRRRRRRRRAGRGEGVHHACDPAGLRPRRPGAAGVRCGAVRRTSCRCSTPYWRSTSPT